MPGRDGTGPWGEGPLTGRGLGPCGRGLAFRRGLDRGFGRGRGSGWRCWPYYSRQYTGVKVTKEEEIKMLEDEVKVLEEEKENITRRIKELKGE